MEKLKAFDAYPKTLEDFRIRTKTGAIISILCSFFMLWLFVSEFAYYLTTETLPEISIDTARSEKLTINFNITFPYIGCAFLGVDSMDISGEHQLDVDHGVFKVRLDKTGKQVLNSKPVRERVEAPPMPNPAAPAGQPQPPATPPCGSCYGAEQAQGQCCNTCNEVMQAYKLKGWDLDPNTISQCAKEALTTDMEEQKGEGCNVYGYIAVNKVAGNFHIAPGKSYQDSGLHVHNTAMLDPKTNITHTVHRLSFGQDFPGIVNPLDGITKTDKYGMSMFQYFVKVVPTTYTNINGEEINTNQYSVTENSKRAKTAEEHQADEKGHAPHTDDRGLPGFYVMYDLSPVMIKFVEHRRSFAHFLTGVCAIVGGVYTVAGLFDSCVYSGMRALKKKVELGKQF